MPVTRCVACLLVTTTGQVLVQWELDATLPFAYSHVALLVASLVQFSKVPDVAQLELSSGHTLVVCSDAVFQLSCVVVCATPAAISHKAGQRPLDVAQLQSLVILHEFLRCYRDQVDAIVVASKTSAATMAETYTLTSALGGQHGHASRDPGGDCTMDEFVHFQNAFIAAMIEDMSAEPSNTEVSDSVEITRQFLMNADTGSALDSRLIGPSLRHPRAWYLDESLPTQKLLVRVARALSASFPLLHRTSLFARSDKDSCVDFSNADSVNTTTVVVRVGSATLRDAGCLYIAVEMLSVRSVPFVRDSHSYLLAGRCTH